MSRLTEAALEDLKARNPVAEVAERLGVRLRKAGRNLVGACPMCGGGRTAARFEVKPDKDIFVCAVCCEGGDVIRLVEKVQGLSFRAAVDWLGGAQEIDPHLAAQREREAKARREKQARAQAQFREQERKSLYDIWRCASMNDPAPALTYLAARGLPLKSLPQSLRCVAAMPYFSSGARDATVIHRGPAMLAAITDAAGIFRGLHITWLNEACTAKAVIADPETGEICVSKKVRGSKQGNVIRLMPAPGPFRRLVIGEGIETVLSAALHGGALADGVTAFWTSVDLGNLGGKAHESVAHPVLKTATGRAQRVPGPEPDFDEPGIVVPDSVTEILMLGDGDSDPVLTRHTLARAAKRWAKPGRVVRMAMAPQGKDFNDLVRESAEVAA